MLGEFRLVQLAAKQAGVTIMASWHSRFGVAVERARGVLTDQQVASLRMI
jgi:predicted dehydrogenase